MNHEDESRMSQDIDAESKRAREETVEILLAELERTMDKQFKAIDTLDSKVGIIFGAGSLVVALMTVAQGSFFHNAQTASVLCPYYVLGAYGLSLFLYLAIMFCVIRAFKVRTYYLPMKIDRDHIQNTYLPLKKHAVKEKLLASYIKHSQTNAAILTDKAQWVQRGLYLLAIDISYLIVLIAVGSVVWPSWP